MVGQPGGVLRWLAERHPLSQMCWLSCHVSSQTGAPGPGLGVQRRWAEPRLCTSGLRSPPHSLEAAAECVACAKVGHSSRVKCHRAPGTLRGCPSPRPQLRAGAPASFLHMGVIPHFIPKLTPAPPRCPPHCDPSDVLKAFCPSWHEQCPPEPTAPRLCVWAPLRTRSLQMAWGRGVQRPPGAPQMEGTGQDPRGRLLVLGGPREPRL